MTTATVNVFRDGPVWCKSVWIDGEFDTSDPMGIDDDASESEALEAARAALADRYTVEVNRVDDIDTKVSLLGLHVVDAEYTRQALRDMDLRKLIKVAQPAVLMEVFGVSSAREASDVADHIRDHAAYMSHGGDMADQILWRQHRTPAMTFADNTTRDRLLIVILRSL